MRNADAPLVEPGRHLREEIAVGNGIPAGIGREGVGRVGHQRDLRGNDLQHQIDERRHGVALDVEFGCKHPFQGTHVVVADVPRIGPRMDRDAVGAEALDVESGPHDVGTVAAARIADDGNLVDIDTQLCHKNTIFACCTDATRRRQRCDVVKLLIFSELRR